MLPVLSRKDNINRGLHAGAELGISKLYNKVCFGYTHDKTGNLMITPLMPYRHRRSCEATRSKIWTEPSHVSHPSIAERKC